MLEVSELTLKFGGLTVLNAVSFTARAGEVTALIGPNGAGKSALLNCISGHYHPGANSLIQVDGRQVQNMAPHRRALSGLARTFQHIHLVPELTVLENVVTGLTPIMDDSVLSCIGRPLRQIARERERYRRAVAALTAFGLAPYMNATVSSLPLGVQRKVDFARSTMSAPKVLLLDEPASGMSRNERGLIPSWIAAAKSQARTAVVWIEHDIDLLLSSADAVIVLQQGEVVAHGRPKDDPSDRQKVVDAYFGRSH